MTQKNNAVLDFKSTFSTLIFFVNGKKVINLYEKKRITCEIK